MSEEARVIEVGSADAGRRLDLFLAEHLALSRSQTRRLLARGVVQIDDRPVSTDAKGAPVAAGARIAVASFTRPEQQRPIAQPELPLHILAEGPGWLAIDKPAGVPVHPLEEHETGTLLGALLARHPEIWGVGEGALRSGVVHRLDVETSGVQLMATREEVWRRLRRAFSEHRVEKTYRAIVLGRIDDAGAVVLPLLTARHRPARVRVVSEDERARSRGVREARLRWRVLERFGAAALVEVQPATGFLHQIRVIFSHLGAPLAGDRTYGRAHDASGAARHMLHACRLAHEEIFAESADPADFTALLAQLRSAG